MAIYPNAILDITTSITFPAVLFGDTSVSGSARPKIFDKTYNIPSETCQFSARANKAPIIEHKPAYQAGIMMPSAILQL
eukprot:scaffold22773_cov126-Skeletonema_dohrnii-CCMP3373.AAC.1